MRAVPAVCVVGFAAVSLACGFGGRASKSGADAQGIDRTPPAGGGPYDYESTGPQRYTTDGRNVAITQTDPIGLEPPAAASNPNDGEETVRWLARESRRYRTFDDNGNGAANGTGEQIKAAAEALPKGAQIRWRATAGSVTSTGVVGSRVFAWPDRQRAKSIAPQTVLEVAFSPAGQEGLPKWAGSPEQLKALRPGDAVILTGTVTSTKWDTQASPAAVSEAPPRARVMNAWRLTLKDARYAPADSPSGPSTCWNMS